MRRKVEEKTGKGEALQKRVRAASKAKHEFVNPTAWREEEKGERERRGPGIRHNRKSSGLHVKNASKTAMRF